MKEPKSKRIFNGKIYTAESSHATKAHAIETAKRRKEGTNNLFKYDYRIVPYKSYTGKRYTLYLRKRD
jgi:hypothetical protein